MVLPTELAHLDPIVVHLLFENITERELVSELASYDAGTLRHHLLTLTQQGYVLGEIVHAGAPGQTARPRCLTIKGYTLLSALNRERRQEASLRMVHRWHGGSPRMTGT